MTDNRYFPGFPRPPEYPKIWIAIAGLLTVSIVIFVFEIPSDGPMHISSVMDVAAHYKTAVCGFCITIVASAAMGAGACAKLIAEQPYVILNLFPALIGIYGLVLAFVAIKFSQHPQEIGNDLNFNRGGLMVSLMLSYFLGGTIHEKKDTHRRNRDKKEKKDKDRKDKPGKEGGA